MRACNNALSTVAAVSPFDLSGARHPMTDPAAIRRGLCILKKIEALALEESMRFTESQIALFTLTDDAKEGQKAFQEKRNPQWSRD